MELTKTANFWWSTIRKPIRNHSLYELFDKSSKSWMNGRKRWFSSRLSEDCKDYYYYHKTFQSKIIRKIPLVRKSYHQIQTLDLIFNGMHFNSHLPQTFKVPREVMRRTESYWWRWSDLKRFLFLIWNLLQMIPQGGLFCKSLLL